MASTDRPRQRGFLLLHLFIHAHRPRNLLRLLPIPAYMIRWCGNPLPSDGHSLPRLRSPLRPNILLRGHRHYKPLLRYPPNWHRPGPMDLGWICCRQRNPNPILYIPLPSPLHRCRGLNSAHPFSSPNRLE